MPIRKVQFSPGEFYHVFNRGNGKQNIFHDERDMYRFLQAIYLSNNSNSSIGITELDRNRRGYTLLEIKQIINENNIACNPLVKIFADCLKDNHYHFLLQEINEGGIIRFMQRLGTGYGKYFSIRYDRPGSLFQGRFKAVHIDNDDQLKYLLAYINVINPAEIIEPEIKEKGMMDIERVWAFVNKYKWSTHPEYMGQRDSIIVDRGIFKEIFPTVESYSKFMQDMLRGKERIRLDKDMMIDYHSNARHLNVLNKTLDIF